MKHPLARVTAFSFMLSGAGSIGFAASYVIGAGTQWEGFCLAIALGGLAAGVLVWGTSLLPHELVVDERDEFPSSSAQRAAAEAAFQRGEETIGRRAVLLRWMAAALALFGIAAIFPIRSLGPGLGRRFTSTKWAPGARVVGEDGVPIRVGDLAIGSVLTVFPEGFVGDAASQTLLLRLKPSALQVSVERADWSPLGYVAYSKVCTHAGCPVGLYRAASLQLLCPCHQSVFDVAEEARPISGPAARPLPQLPLLIGKDGFLRARTDYQEPIGPGFWERT